MPQQTAKPARPAIRAGQALGLTIFVATAAVLVALLLSRLGAAFDSGQKAAVSFSTLCAAIAAFAMLLDAADLWVRGRTMTAYSVSMFRSLRLRRRARGLAASLLGANSLVIIFLAPAMITYLFITRKNPNNPRTRRRRARHAPAPAAVRPGRRAALVLPARPRSRASARAARSTTEPSGLRVTPA